MWPPMKDALTKTLKATMGLDWMWIVRGVLLCLNAPVLGLVVHIPLSQQTSFELRKTGFVVMVCACL